MSPWHVGDGGQRDTVISKRRTHRIGIPVIGLAMLGGLAMAAGSAADDASVRILRPRAMGAAAKLASTRSLDDADPLDRVIVEGLELAPPDLLEPGITTRAGTTQLLYASQTQLQLANREQAVLSYQSPTLSTSKIGTTSPVLTSPEPLPIQILPAPVLTPLPYPKPQPEPSPAPSGGDFDAEQARFQLERGRQVYEMLESRLSELKELRARRQQLAEDQKKALSDVKGPSAVRPVNLLEGMRVDPGVPLAQSDVLRIGRSVYQDANPETGVFYYVPQRYDLAWDPDSQYGMTVIYGMAGADESEGEVFMAARLDAKVDLAEIEVARQLLRAYTLRHSNEEAGRIRFTQLRPLPLRGASQVELFGGSNHEFAVDPGSVNVRGVTDLLDTLDVSWATDVKRLLNIESLLRTDAGLHGGMTFEAASAEPFSATAPLEISVAVPTTFGRIPFVRNQEWRNDTFYPVTLHAVHSLVIAPERYGFAPVVYTWRLDDAEVAPGEVVRWEPDEVPEWVDRVAQIQWVAYSVQSRCEPCDEKVFTERFIPAPPPTQMLMVTTGDVFEATGAERVAIHVRSPFLDPQRDGIRQQPGVALTGDGEEIAIGRLFLRERELSGAGASQPFYEYRLEVTMEDGEVHRGDRWLPSRELDLLVGSATLRESLGFVPDASQSNPADEEASP